MYETFFFEWSIAMRDGKDTAGCFADPRFVYESYCAFVRARRLDQRIAESRTRRLSAWDKKILSLCGLFTFESRGELRYLFDPFGVVDSSAERNHFQEFWEYMLPYLTEEERERLLASMRIHFPDDFR